MTSLQFALALTFLTSLPLAAQDLTHNWIHIRTDSSAVVKFRELVENYVDSSNVQRAGVKRQVWMRASETKWNLDNIATTKDELYQAMVNCGTYQFRLVPDRNKLEDNEQWKDIDLNDNNMWRKVAKLVCPKESQ